MKAIKTLGVIAIAAIAAMALIGASSASAVTLCKAKEKKCAAGSRYALGTVIKAALKKDEKGVAIPAKLVTNLGTVECTSSTTEGKTTQESGSPLKGEITGLTFTSCKLGETACTVSVEHLPYAASIVSTGEGNSNGALTATEKEAGKKPQALVKCGSLIKCIVGNKETTLEALGGAPATVKANAVKFELIKNEGFICPSEAKWTAEYTVSAPNPLFVTAEP